MTGRYRSRTKGANVSITVNFNASATQAYDTLNATNSALNTTIGEMSSGLAIQTAASNPAGYVSAGLLGDQAAGYGVDITNAQNGVSMLQTAQGALNQAVSIVQQMQQLAYSSANSGSTDPAAAAANQQEYSALQSDLTQIANTTKFGSQVLLSGTYTGTFQVGTGVSSYSQLAVTISTAATDTGLGLNTTSVDTQANATTAITSLSAAINTVDSMQAYLGAQQNKLQDIVANLTVGQQNLQSAQSRIVDTNFAQASTQLATQQILEQTGASMLATAQQAPNIVLKALGL
jgi:flagellin